VKAAALAMSKHDVDAAAAVADFNRLALFYRWMEWFTFGPFLWRCRLAFLSEMQSQKSALILGDGDGRFTAALLKANSQIEVDAVDASAAMLRQMMLRAEHDAVRVRTYCADARRLDFPSRKFDLIATHFFLDCLTTGEVASLAVDLRERMTSGSAWIISEFATPDTAFGKLFAGPLVSALYFAFRVLTGLTVRHLPDHRGALIEAGFVLSKQQNWLGGLLVSEMWKRSCIPIRNR
jgi:hypothetical protein